ncbi:MAG TPA: long-chain fatty acid--CoA ligase [Bacteroidia bacterium]|jgi:long-chain acyl-CoA synthetase|nr:long-chain fatty acid--CoA ligase [Bacteroidia bacterium]
MQVTRIFDILDKLQDQFADKPNILAHKERKGIWKEVSVKEFVAKVNYVSAALLQKGIKPGDTIALIANNRPEWNYVDYACQQIGAILVPVYPTISQHDLDFILAHAEVKGVFFSSIDILRKLQKVSAHQNLGFLSSFNDDESKDSFLKILELGQQHYAERKNEIENIKKNIHPNDLISILYTSGTTGVPKGVMLSHNNILSNALACQYLVPFDPKWHYLSFLPLNHVYERMFGTLILYLGISVYYAQAIETVAENLQEVNPQVIVTVPRLLERVYDRMLSRGTELTGLKKKIFDWALDLALKYEPDGANGIIYELKRKIADKLVFVKWREALGGKLMFIVSGGAALQPRLSRSFTCAGIHTFQGFGLTETSPVISTTYLGKGNNIFGTVGKVIKDTTVKIAEDGEILVKGPGVMLGYYKNPEATAEAIDKDNWFHTGDIGTFVHDNFLKITDRKKEIFKTSAGKYITPLVLENKLKECRFVEQCMVVGEQQKFASALIVPSFDYIKEWCEAKGIAFTTNEEMIQNADIRKEINTFIREMNRELSPYEHIKRPELLAHSWSIETGELTPKMSMKRKVILEKNKAVIDKIFSKEE